MNKFSIAILAQEDNVRLRRTLTSVYSLDNINEIDVVIVDNGSVKPISHSLTSYPNLKIVRNEKDEGYSIGKNLAVSNTVGEYVLLLDDDILIPNNHYLSEVFSLYKSFNDIAFLGLLMVDEGQDQTRYHGMKFTFYGLDFFRKALTLEEVKEKHGKEIGSYHGGAVFFKKETWNQLGGYDTSQPIMLDDFDISARARLFGYKNYLYSLQTCIHTGKLKDNDKKRFARKYKYFYSGFVSNIIKNYSWKNVIITLPIFTLFSIALALALTYKKNNIYIIFSFSYSYLSVIRNFISTFRERKLIRAKLLHE